MTKPVESRTSEEPPFAEVHALFHELCDLPEDEQRAGLDELGEGRASLRREVEGLLFEDAAAEGPLDGTPYGEGSAVSLSPSVARSDWIGGYEILGELGRGGMGVVYEARQETPRRTVALKLIRPGIVTDEVLQRFGREAELLGALNHPGIAQVYEAGKARTPAGELPFIAMELVRGERLDRFVLRERLSGAEILELVARLCDAVHHAHQRGVVHRDLNPANVLVAADRSLKVLDFGVARAVRHGSEHAARTRTGELIGTLAYMSPEQVRSDLGDVEARTDVYALGVMTYELLSGTRPYEVDALTLPEAARTIAEVEPLPLGGINGRWRGDVEVIVATALAKEKRRRYASAAALAADVRRHLADEPIQARPASRTYLLSKFARRNKAIFGGMAAAFVAMAVGTAIALWQAGEARGARRVADQERRLARIEAYRGTLAAAQASFEIGNVLATQRALDRVPLDERGWEWRFLANQLDFALAVVDDEPSAACAMDPSGALVSVSEGGAVRWRDAASGRILRSARTEIEDPRRIVLSGDGRRLAFLHGSDPVRVGLLDLEASGGPMALLDVALEDSFEGGGTHLVLSGDGGTVAVSSAATAFVWEPGASTPLRWDHGMSPRSLAVNATGSKVGVVGDVDGTGVYRVFDVVRREASSDLGRDVLTLALSPDGLFAATSETDDVVRLRRTNTGSVLERFAASVETGVAAVFDGSGERLAVAGTDGALRVWPLRERREEEGPVPGEILSAIPPVVVLPGHPVPIRRFGFDASGRYLVSLDEAGTARVCDSEATPGGTPLRGHYLSVDHVDAAGSVIVAASAHGVLTLWEAASATCFANLPFEPDDFRAFHLSPDGAWIATGHRAEVRLRPTENPVQVRVLPTGGAEVLSIAAHADRLATLDADGRLAVWDTGSEALVFEEATGIAAGGDMAFSASGSRLAVCRPSEWVLFDGRGARVASHEVGGAELHAVEWLRDETLVATGWSDGIRLFDDGGALVARMASANGEILSLAARPDGARFAAGTSRGVIEVWDVATERMTLELHRPLGGVLSLSFFDGGASLLSHFEEAALVWDTVPPRVRHETAGGLDALDEELLELLRGWLAVDPDPSSVAEGLWGDPRLDERRRRAALRWTLNVPPPTLDLAGDPFDGHALVLGGTDDHATVVGGDEALRMTAAYTIEAWVRPRATPGITTVLNKEGEFQISLGGEGELRWLVAGPDGWLPFWIPVRYRAEPGSWIHLALVRDGAVLGFFLNGRRVQTVAGPPRIGDHHPSMNELRIGGRQHTPSGFVGEIDEVRIWSVARTAEEIREALFERVPADAPGLMSAWSFDEGEGDAAADLTGRHEARLTGASWRATSRKPR